MGSGSMVVTGAELALLQEEINTAISAIWERLEALEELQNDVKEEAKPDVDPDFDAVAEVPLKHDAKPAKKPAVKKAKTTKKEDDMVFEVN